MSKSQTAQPLSFSRAVKKYFVSGFVVFTFAAYVLHERTINADGAAADTALKPNVAVTRQILNPSIEIHVAPTPTPTARPVKTLIAPTAAATASAPQAVQVLPSPTVPQATEVPPAPAITSQGQYKDGEYTGNLVNAIYGLVQVKAIIQDGHIADVQFLRFPNDRRTSVRINNVAVPWLQSEAIQAQRANVDIVSGATLTSEAFIRSLQIALDAAKSSS
jgi:uncharacterized protein with FMN-binding domain